jgi:RHS repeat-associated protein
MHGPYRYTGAVQHSNTIAHLGARDYEPWSGLWLQADTIIPDPRNPQSLNRYAYVLGRPTRYVDPTGRFAETLLHDSWGSKEAWEAFAADNPQVAAALLAADYGDVIATTNALSIPSKGFPYPFQHYQHAAMFAPSRTRDGLEVVRIVERYDCQ